MCAVPLRQSFKLINPDAPESDIFLEFVSLTENIHVSPLMLSHSEEEKL